MKVLVTGGAGFIGSAFIKKIIQTKDEISSIICLDNLDYSGDIERLKSIESNSRFSFVKGSILDRNLVKGVMKGVDNVYNFAAQTHVDRSLLNSENFFMTNAVGTQVLIEEARCSSVSKFIHVSTDEVYGSRKSGKFTEDDKLTPSNPYSVSKAAAENLVYSAYLQDGFPGIVTRGSNTYGPYQYPEKIIPLFISNLIRNEPVPLYGKGLQRRDWLHVDDHANGVWFAGEKGEVGQVYNISGSKELSNHELTLLVIGYMEKDDSYIKYVTDRPGHDFRYALDDNKLKSLGWKVEKEFDSSFPKVIEWYKENQSWLGAIRQKNGQFDTYYKKQYQDRA